MSSQTVSLTSLPVDNTPQAWKVCFRFGDPIENLKFLAIVSLVYDFLISLMRNWRGWVRIAEATAVPSQLVS